MKRIGVGFSIALTIGAILMAAPASAAAVTTIGSSLSAAANSGSACNTQPCTFVSFTIPGRATASPIDGVVTRWRIRGPAGSGQLALRVIRPAGGNTFVGAGTSATVAVPVVPELQEFTTQLPIRAGDFVGLNVPFGAQNPSGMIRTTAGATRSIFEPRPADGGPPATPLGPFDNDELLYNADVEPDCDGDGLGDETQDGDTSTCNPPPGDAAAPNATITKGPKNKTKKKTATFHFSGIDARVLAGFQCSLDGGAFAACTSPHTVKVKKGKHTFSVRATDQAGNVDGTPATDSWKVKRKRRRR